MATKKGKKKSSKLAKVQLDAATVHQFESHLRDGLVGSGAVMSTENQTPPLKGQAKVQLDADTAARLSEVLRKGLVASQVVMATETPQLDKMTRKVKKAPPTPKAGYKKR